MTLTLRRTHYFMLVLFLSPCTGSRDKRFIRINPDSPMTLGFLWNAPVALILPTLVAKEGDKFDQLFHSDSVDEEYHDEEGSETLVSSSRSFKHPVDELPKDLTIDPAYKKQTHKIMTFFAHLQIPYLTCQEKIICDMAFNTNFYAPVSKYILKELKLNHGPITHGEKSLMWRYVEAARQGISAENSDVCSHIYTRCRAPTHRLINVSVIKVLQYLSSKFNLNII